VFGGGGGGGGGSSEGGKRGRAKTRLWSGETRPWRNLTDGRNGVLRYGGGVRETVLRRKGSRDGFWPEGKQVIRAAGTQRAQGRDRKELRLVQLKLAVFGRRGLP